MFIIAGICRELGKGGLIIPVCGLHVSERPSSMQNRVNCALLRFSVVLWHADNALAGLHAYRIKGALPQSAYPLVPWETHNFTSDGFNKSWIASGSTLGITGPCACLGAWSQWMMLWTTCRTISALALCHPLLRTCVGAWCRPTPSSKFVCGLGRPSGV